MGMFDTVYAECPKCSELVEFQSKAGVCEFKSYHINSVPPEIASDIVGDYKYCSYCDKAVYLSLSSPIMRVKMQANTKEVETYD